MSHYVIFHGDIPVGAFDGMDDVPSSLIEGQHTYETPWNWKSFDRVERIARLLEISTGQKYLPVDHGSHTTPQFGIIEPPKMGDKVSYSFNGDSYPDGEIIRITPTYQITTSGGHKYRRRGNRGYWLREGGTWSLIPGHISERNPSF